MAQENSMGDRRPIDVTFQIENAFRALKEGGGVYADPHSVEGFFVDEYVRLGKSPSYTWLAPDTSSQELLKEDGLTVIDLGCANGGMVRAYNARNPVNRAYGITGNTYGQQDSRLIVGDLHFLEDYFPEDIEPADRVVTQTVFEHLIDPAAALEQAARKVGKQGFLVMDNYYLRANRGSRVASHVLRYLMRSGHFRLVGRNAQNVMSQYVDDPSYGDPGLDARMPSVMMQRQTKPSKAVELPVSYDENPETGLWEYIAI